MGGAMSRPTTITVVGLHPIVASQELIEETREMQWGAGLSGKALEQANNNVRKHFEKLFLLEIEVEPPEAAVDWSEITQPIPGQPRENWQAPWDEQLVGSGHWVFWLHSVDVMQPLQTELGELPLPLPTATPSHLANIIYEAP
jgi:hypothetical protein